MNKVKSHIKTLRFKFAESRLSEEKISRSPFVQFEGWLRHSLRSKVNEPNAMTLATSLSNGEVDARIVLLRDYNTKGFSFFTNYHSIKGKEIRQNKKVCLNFFWAEVHRQIRIKGVIEKLSSTASNAYFASRPRSSQLAAWASHQSEKLSGLDELESRYKFYEKKYSGRKVPRPPHWGGYIVRPTYFEFWQGQTNRMHDRIIYEKNRRGKWSISRLNP